jgi:hypothetical protein
VIWPLRLGAAAQGSLALYQKFGEAELRPAGTFLDTNHMSGWLGAVLLLGLVRSRAESGRARAAAWLLALPVGAALLVSGSRSAMLGLAVGAIWIVWRLWCELDRRQRRAIAALAALALVVGGWRVAERMVDGDRFRHHRIQIWSAAIGPFLDDPWLGSGPGQYAIAARRHQFPDGDGPLNFDKQYRTTHSDLLRVPAEFGAPVALLLLATLALTLRSLRRRGAPREQPAGWGVGAEGALVLLATQALVSNPSRWPAAYLLGGVLLGTLLSRSAESSPHWSVPRRLAAAAAALFLLVAGEWLPTAAHFVARDVASANPTTIDRLAIARRLNPIHPGYPARIGEQLAETADPFDLARYARSRELTERAIALSPRNARYHVQRARIEARGCLQFLRTEASCRRADTGYERAQSLAPYDARIPIERGRLALQLGDPGSARRAAETALRIEPHAVAAHLLLAEALLAANPADADAAAARLDLAARIADEHRATAAQSGYSRDLLTLDLPRADALRARLLDSAGADGSG